MENSVLDKSVLVQSVLMASPNGVLVLQPIFSLKGGRLDLFLTSINAAAQKDLTCPVREVLGQSLGHFFPHLAGREAMDRYWDVISTGQPDQFEITSVRAGQSIPSLFEVSVVPILHNLLITYTEMPRTSDEDDTAESGATLLQQAFNEAANGLSVFEVILDNHGQPSDFRLVMLNKAGRTMSGSLGEELVGKTLWEMYPATKINGLFDRYVQVWQTGVLFSSEHYYPEYDIWRDVKIVRVERGVLVSYTDITALKKSEEQARQQAQLVDDLLERMPVGIAVLTPVTYENSVGNRQVYFKVVRVNSLFEEVIGLSASQTVGQFTNRLLSKTNAEELLKSGLAALESGKTQVIELELAAYSSAQWYQLSVAPTGEQLIVSFTNITPLKQAQHHQTELLDSVLSGSQNAILAFDSIRDSTGTIVDFRYVLQNEAKRQLAGRTDEQTLGRTMLDVFPQVREKGLLDRYVEVVTTGYPLRTQTEFNYGNKLGWYDLSAVKYGDGLVLTIQEKTVEQQILHQLQSNSELLQTIIDNTPAGLVFWEAVRDDKHQLIDFRYRLSNLMDTYTTGHSPETLLGQDLLRLFPRFCGTPLETSLRETIETGQTQRMMFTDYVEASDGWFDAQFIRVGDGVLMSYINVTEAHQVQLAQKHQADLMHLVINAQPAGIVLYEPVRQPTIDGQPGPIVDFTYVLVNETERRLTGRSDSELIGQRFRQYFPSDQGQEFFTFLVDVAETGQPKEWLLPFFSDGIRGWFQSSVVRHGHQVLFTFLDVTELKRQQQELEHTNQNLRRSNENLQKFAYVASHDLQEPLRKIQSFGDMLATNYVQVLDETAQDIIGRMQGAAHRMSSLIKHLLTYSRLSTQLVQVKPIRLIYLLNHALDDLSTVVQESGARIEWGDLPVIQGDEGQLVQLFHNLLSNALKYRRHDVSPQIQINCRTVAAKHLPVSVRHTITPTIETGETTLFQEINVTDNGIGFDEKYLDRIFQVFQRLHGKDVYAGTGIGLAICQKVVENHRGALTATSQPGAGATFSVYLPIPQT